MDLDVYNGTLASLQAWAGEHAPTTAPRILEGLAARFTANADGRPELFVLGRDQAVWSTVQLGDGSWSSWITLKGVVASEPTGVLETDGRINLFVVGTNGSAYRKAQSEKNSQFVSGWTSMGGEFVSQLVPIRGTDGRMLLFGVGADGCLLTAHELTAGGASGWSSFVSLGGALASSPSVVQNADGRLEAFALGKDGALWHAAAERERELGRVRVTRWPAELGAGGHPERGWDARGLQHRRE